MDASTRRERLRKVKHLLGNVESTGDEAADEHVAAATAIVAELLPDES
nr:hypothetical protein [Haloarcula sp. CK38]